MLSVIRNTIPFHLRRRSAHGQDATLSGHVLRDIGFESRQVEEILSYVARTSSDGRLSHGADAELSRCRRPAANSNEREPTDQNEVPDWWFSRMQATVAAEVERLKRCPED